MDFVTETIKLIQISPSLHQTINERFDGSNKPENPRIGIFSRDTPAIPTQDFSSIHNNNMHEDKEHEHPNTEKQRA